MGDSFRLWHLGPGRVRLRNVQVWRQGAAWAWLWTAVVAVACGGCGAKTGLLVPDAGPDAATGTDRALGETPCVVLPTLGEGAQLPLQTTARLGRADVALLVDVSGSMGGEIDAIRAELRDLIVPGIEAEIPDVRFAVASFSDFPVLPYGLPGVDSPFRLRVPMTSDVIDVQGAVDALVLEDGQDHHEAHVEALYLMATGASSSSFVEPSFGCPGGGFGYPCFREDGLPVILLFTDAPMHNGPSGESPYDPFVLPSHGYAEARDALNERQIRVIGIFSGTDPARDRPDLASVVRDTGAVNGEGRPLVFDIGPDGRGLGEEVIQAVKVFTDSLVFDVTLEVRDEDRSDGIDATQFVQSVVPVRAEPAGGVEAIDRDSGTFVGLRSGTRVLYEIQLRNDAVVPGTQTQRFTLVGVFHADGLEVLGEVEFEIVVPGADGEGCEAPGALGSPPGN